METKTFKGIGSIKVAEERIKTLTKAIQEMGYPKLEQTNDIKKQIHEWRDTIEECQHAIIFFKSGEK